MFTKQHYEKIAEVINFCDNKEEIINELSDMFEGDNEMFDKYKFKLACKGLLR